MGQKTLGLFHSPCPFLILPEFCLCHLLPLVVQFLQDDTSIHTTESLHSQENVSNEDRMKGDRWVDQEVWRRPEKGNNPTAGSICPAGRIKRSSARVLTNWPPVGQWRVLARQDQDGKNRCVSTVTMLAVRFWWSGDSLMAAQTSMS